MNIHAKPGHKVQYIGAEDSQVKWGGCDDPRKFLTVGEIYTVAETEIYSFHTKVSLQGFDGKFPSTAFEDA